MVRLNGNDSGVSYVYQRPNYFPEHTAPHIKIAVPFEGASIRASWQTASGQRKQQHVKQGHVTILPANLPHETTQERQMEMIVISLEPLLVEQLADELTGKSIEVIEQWAVRDPLIQQIGIELRREFQLGSPRMLYVESVINILTTHLIRHYCARRLAVEDSTAGLSPGKLQQAIAYINDQLERDLTLSELAGVVQMSQYRFARAFKQSIGLPPHQYLLLQRIERAKKLLSKTQLSLSQISYQLGFASQSHFSATFRRFTATTPKAYREHL
jgi:AraC family transcriptional regulator